MPKHDTHASRSGADGRSWWWGGRGGGRGGGDGGAEPVAAAAAAPAAASAGPAAESVFPLPKPQDRLVAFPSMPFHHMNYAIMWGAMSASMGWMAWRFVRRGGK